MRIKEIQSLIKFVAKSGASEVSLEMKDVKITIKTSQEKGSSVFSTPNVQSSHPAEINVIPQTQAAPLLSEAVPITQTTPAEDESNLVTVRSPIIGTFYRKPAPDKPVFVEVGDTVSEGACFVL